MERNDKYLIDEIRLNRASIERGDDKLSKAIEKVDDKLSSKVGRTELFGWIASSMGVVGIALRLLIIR